MHCLFPADKNACFFCHIVSFASFLFYIISELLVSAQDVLILIAMAGKDICDQRFCILNFQLIFIFLPRNFMKIWFQDFFSVFFPKFLIQIVS